MTESRRIIIVTSDLGTGGAERVIAQLANAWAARGRPVTLVLTFRGVRQGRREPLRIVHRLHPGIDVLELAATPGLRGAGPVAGMRRALALRRLLARMPGADVISFLTRVNVLVLFASLGMRPRPVISERMAPGLLREPAINRLARRLLYPGARCAVVQTERGRRWLASEVPGLSIRVVPNAVVAAPRLSLPVVDPASVLAPQRRLLLSVGRLVEQKGHDRLIEAFASIADAYPAWDLAILGEGSWRARLESLVDLHGLAARIHLPGVSGDLAPWLARADLFVLPSLAEGFPNALAEAMLAGVAVVAFDCETGPADLIDPGVNGVLVRPVGDAGALARALETLMADAPQRRRLAERAPAVAARYSPERVLAAWERVLEVGDTRQPWPTGRPA